MTYDLEEHYKPLNEKDRPSDDQINEMIEKKFACELCEDTGEVTTMERVYPNEPHTAPIGTEKCICRLPDEDEYDDQE